MTSFNKDMPSKSIFSTKLRFTSYSLNYEDVILHRLFREQRQGFYVDVGAGHPRFENDLYALYERGWTGINIEPNEEFFGLHEQLRPRDINLCMVLSDMAGPPLTYYEIEGSGLSTCDKSQAEVHLARGHEVKTRNVPVGTLAGILADAGVSHIEVLKVDVEGFEEKVLGGNDWERFRPSVVLVEATYPESPERRPSNIRGFMEQRGYRHVLFDGLNDFYLERSFAEPEDLSLPPNVFDGFALREIVDLGEQVRALKENFTAAETYALSLKTTLNDMEFQLGAALKAAEAMSEENKRVHHYASKLTSDNRRWRSAVERMQGEISVLNKLLEPLHTATEHMNQMRQSYDHELTTVRGQLQRETGALQQQAHDLHERLEYRDGELRRLNATLVSIYTSRSWFLTKPWRFAGRIVKRLIG